MRRSTLHNSRGSAMRFLIPASGLLVLAACSAQSAPVTDQQVVERSRPVAEAFQAELKQQLQAAMKTGGPTAGVEVCKHAAPAIAQSASEESGAQVSRIALRNRNPAGTVPADLRPAYEELAREPVADGKPAYRIVRTGQGEGTRIHFLGAIPMQAEPCSACHGKSIAPEVAEVLDREYPEDKARGFEPGELRGALDISWPMEAFGNES